ncbi:MAG: hypothetical protein ACHQPI_06120 [Thermoanaerobaculia bacterium]
MATLKRESASALRATAFHEAGHAVMHVLAGHQLQLLSIKPGQESHGGTKVVPQFRVPSSGPVSPQTVANVEAAVCILLAGWEAQQRAAPKSARGHGTVEDARKAVDLIDVLSGSSEEVQAWIHLLEVRTRHRVAHYWRAVNSVATALLEKETLDGAEAGTLIHEALRFGGRKG